MSPKRLEHYLVERIRPGGDYAALLHFPSYFEIETVHACNARCIMCPGISKDRPAGPMDPGFFNRIVEQISQHREHVIRVGLFRDGEPLLDPDLEQRVEELKAAGIRSVATTSNMSLMTAGRAESLLRSGLDMIDMSIDGLSEAVFERIRRGLSYETVKDNAIGFIRLRDRIAPQCKIRVRLALQEDNAEEWPAFETYWRQRLGAADMVIAHPVHNWGGNLKSSARRGQSPLPPQALPCVSLWSLMIVYVNGQVPLCTGIWEPAGDARTTALAAIWHSPAFQRLRDLHLSQHRAQVPACRGCLAWAPSSHIESIDQNYMET